MQTRYGFGYGVNSSRFLKTFREPAIEVPGVRKFRSTDPGTLNDAPGYPCVWSAILDAKADEKSATFSLRIQSRRG